MTTESINYKKIIETDKFSPYYLQKINYFSNLLNYYNPSTSLFSTHAYIKEKFSSLENNENFESFILSLICHFIDSETNMTFMLLVIGKLYNEKIINQNIILKTASYLLEEKKYKYFFELLSNTKCDDIFPLINKNANNISAKEKFYLRNILISNPSYLKNVLCIDNEKYDVIADDIGKKSLYTIFVYDKKTKKTKVYLTFETLLTKYKIYLHSDNKDDIIEAINIKYPNLEVTYNKNSLEGPYIVYEYPTMKKLYECRTILETSAKTGISRNTIRDDLFSYSKYIYDDKFIIIPSNWKNIDYKEFTYKPITNKRVRLINVETRDKIDFDSIAEMGKYLNVTSNVAYRIYHNKGIYNGFEIRTLDE